MLAPWLLSACLAPGNLVPNGDFEQAGAAGLPAGWTVAAPRDETLPNPLRDPHAGRGGGAAAGLIGVGERTFGQFQTTAPGVTPGGWYRIGASYRTEDVADPAHSVWLKLTWLDAKATPLRTDYVNRRRALDGGWQRTEDHFRAPEQAAAVALELSLRWTSGTVWFDEVEVAPEATPPARKVKLATVCFVPEGGTPATNRHRWAEQVAAAAKQGADIVCLGEGITIVGTAKSFLEVAEPVPGPTTEALGAAAAAGHCYVVAGLYEQDGKDLYNTAVLLGRDGKLVGKYRKTHLPESECSAGITPGSEYPVFDTDFGKVGIQICYDNDFPEVARALALNGAEIVFTPIWGDGRFDGAAWDVVPRARAIDNGVWYVASNYSQQRSLIVSPWGEVRADTGGKPGVVVAEADLQERRQQKWLSSAPGGYWEALYRQERRPTTYGDLTR